MATTPVSDQSSRNKEKVCKVEVSHQEQPAAKKSVGGFDCEFVEQPTKTFQVNCPVCLLVLRESHQATCCGNNFCHSCIECIQAEKKPCPTCNKPEFSVVSIKGYQRLLDELHVYCSHKNDGCQWKGELGELDKHLNGSPILGREFVGCEFAEVKCNDCQKLCQRQHFKAHQLEQHPFSCEYCHDYESYCEDVVKNHYPICEFYPVPCPNECGVYPERQNLEYHVSRDCPLTVVNCDYHYAGCEVQLIRQDLPAHLAENLVHHMAQLATYNQKKVQEKDQQIMKLTEDLRKELEVNRQKIERLERENEGLSKSLLEKKDEIAQLQEDLRVKDKATTDKFTELREDTRVKEEALKQEIAQLWQRQEDAATKEEILKQEITELRQKQDNALSEEEAQKKDEALQHEIATVKQQIEDLKREQTERENKAIAQLKTTEEEAQKEVNALKEDITRIQEHVQKKDEAMRQEIVELKQEQRENDNKIIARLKTTEEEAQKKDDTLQHEIATVKQQIEDLKREQKESENKAIAQLKTTEEEAQNEVNALKEKFTRMQEHVQKTDEAVRQEIVELKQEERESKNEIIVRLKTTEEEAQKKEETLQHEIATVKQQLEDLKREQTESENKAIAQLKTTEEEAQKEVNALKAIKQEIAELRERIEENEAVKQEVTQVGEKQEETVSKEDYETTKQELTQLKAKQETDRSSLQTLQSYTGPPVDFTMIEFEKHNQDGDEWYSEPFYTHPYGYKMCLNVNANGSGAGRGTHVSVFCYLMQGKFDDRLRWPFQGHITVQLINHLEDKEHYTATLDFSNADSDLANRVMTGDRSKTGKGIIKFIPHTELGEDPDKNRQFLKDNCLCFRVTRVTNLNWTSLERQCVAIESRVCVPPFEFTMTNFEQQKTDNDIWYSPSFYTHPRGYKMCLRVHANGDDAAKGTDVSMFIHLVRQLPQVAISR